MTESLRPGLRRVGPHFCSHFLGLWRSKPHQAMSVMAGYLDVTFWASLPTCHFLEPFLDSFLSQSFTILSQLRDPKSLSVVCLSDH